MKSMSLTVSGGRKSIQEDRDSEGVETPRARARSVMTTRLYNGRPESATSHRVPSARKKKEDVPVLTHPSLMTFASFVSQPIVEQIVMKLGVSKSTVNSIKSRVIDEVCKLPEPIVMQNFKLLWSWRGRKSTKKMVDQFLNVLRGINRWDLAAIVNLAHREHRRMCMSDFM